jgi:coenzyme PQQ synthesis protein D (PqqD)
MSEIAARVRFTADRDGAAILDIERNQLITLNPTGGFVWERLARGMSVSMIVQELAETTETDPQVVEGDVRAFLGQLAKDGLIDK